MDKFLDNDEYVTSVIVDICTRSFYLVSNEGVIQEIQCDMVSQFMDLLEMVNCVVDLDSDIAIIYADPTVSENAGVV